MNPPRANEMAARRPLPRRSIRRFVGFPPSGLTREAPTDDARWVAPSSSSPHLT
jgi:hypothetical protein